MFLVLPVVLVVTAQPVLVWIPVVRMVVVIVMVLTTQMLPPRDQAVLAI
jgi:hypothetical protein